jgi:hypothetical protein
MLIVKEAQVKGRTLGSSPTGRLSNQKQREDEQKIITHSFSRRTKR